MAERKRRKQKHESSVSEPTKEELKIAKYVRFNTPKKSTVFQKQSLEYFVGSKAIDTLMNSKWAKASKKADPLFHNRDDAVHFMEQLLQSNMLYRAKKVLKESKTSKDDPQKSKSTKPGDEDDKQSKVRRRKKAKDEDENGKKALKEGQGSGEKGKKLKSTDEKKSEEKKKKRKYKLEVHEEQIFLDSSDLYVWIYDPLSPRKILLGAVVLLGIIGATLFPLWPPSVRIGVYYLSVCGGIFVGTILGVALCRSVLFGVIWLVTLGKHHIWFLPNLLADVGFFESFKPFYTHEIQGDAKEKDKSSDTEEEEEVEPEKTPPSDVDAPSEEDAPPAPSEEDAATENTPPHKDDSQDEVTPAERSIDNGSSEVSDSEDVRSSQTNDDRNSSSDYEIIESEKPDQSEKLDEASA